MWKIVSLKSRRNHRHQGTLWSSKIRKRAQTKTLRPLTINMTRNKSMTKRWTMVARKWSLRKLNKQKRMSTRRITAMSRTKFMMRQISMIIEKPTSQEGQSNRNKLNTTTPTTKTRTTKSKVQMKSKRSTPMKWRSLPMSPKTTAECNSIVNQEQIHESTTNKKEANKINHIKCIHKRVPKMTMILIMISLIHVNQIIKELINKKVTIAIEWSWHIIRWISGKLWEWMDRAILTGPR